MEEMAIKLASAPPPRDTGAFCFWAASCNSFYRFKPPAEAGLNSHLKSLFGDPRHANPTKRQD
jgi:hypothetical protein